MGAFVPDVWIYDTAHHVDSAECFDALTSG